MCTLIDLEELYDYKTYTLKISVIEDSLNIITNKYGKELS